MPTTGEFVLPQSDDEATARGAETHARRVSAQVRDLRAAKSGDETGSMGGALVQLGEEKRKLLGELGTAG